MLLTLEDKFVPSCVENALCLEGCGNFVGKYGAHVPYAEDLSLAEADELVDSGNLCAF